MSDRRGGRARGAIGERPMVEIGRDAGRGSTARRAVTITICVDLGEDEGDGLARQVRRDPVHHALKVCRADVAFGVRVKGTERAARDLVGLLHREPLVHELAEPRQLDSRLEACAGAHGQVPGQASVWEGSRQRPSSAAAAPSVLLGSIASSSTCEGAWPRTATCATRSSCRVR
jgi:hypothetical protein